MTTLSSRSPSPPIFGDACFDESGRYRYRLTRAWDRCGPRVVFIMLNPSTADARRDDPTIRRAIGFARRWRFASLTVVNLFAWRATRVADLRRAADPIGPLNDEHILDAVRSAERVVAAWGNHGVWRDRGRTVAGMLPAGVSLLSLGMTNEGMPRHPLYVPANARLRRYRIRPPIGRKRGVGE